MYHTKIKLINSLAKWTLYHPWFFSGTINKIILPGYIRKKILPILENYLFTYTPYLPPHEIDLLQLKRIRILLVYSFNHVPYWHKKFTEIAFSLKILKNLSKKDFNKIPPLTRIDLRLYPPSEYLSTSMNPKFFFENITSGSTGEPFKIILDLHSLPRRIAFWFRSKQWAGLHSWNSFLIIMRAPLTWQQDLGLFFKCRNINDIEEKKEEIYKLLQTKRYVVDSLPSHMIHLARLIRDDNTSFDVTALITEAEYLSNEERDFLEKVLKCPVYRTYAAREFGPIGHECEIKDGYHINSEWLYVEIVDEKNNLVPDGTRGRILITSLDNFAMPLIRYEVGDLGYFISQKCPCGRNLPRLKFEGRTKEIIHLQNGKNIHTFEILRLMNKRVDCIKQFQVIQNTINEFIVKIVPDINYTPQEERELKMNLGFLLGEETKIVFEKTEKIEAAPSGKKIAFKSRLSQ